MPNNTYEPLSSHQITPLSADELRLLRDTAAGLNITPGLLARRLILLAIDTTDDATLAALARDEARAAAARRQAAGRAAADRRWGRA